MVSELNVDHSTLVQKDLEYAIGDWLELAGDYINAAEYNPKLRKEISRTTWSPSNNPGAVELVSSFGGKWLVRTEQGRYYQVGNRELKIPGNFRKINNESNEVSLKDIDMPIKDKGVFSQVGNDNTTDDTSDLNTYRDKVTKQNGSDYRNDKPVSPGYLDEESLDEGILGSLKKGAVTVAMLVGFMANAQSPKEEAKLKDIVMQNADTELLTQIKSDPRFEGWSDGAINKVFDTSKEIKTPLKKVENLDLGKYGHVAKMSKPANRTQSGKIKYHVDITSKSHIPYVINYLKDSGMADTIINFSYRGTEMSNKTLTL